MSDFKQSPEVLAMRREALKIAERQGQVEALERVRDDENSTPAEILEAVKMLAAIRG